MDEARSNSTPQLVTPRFELGQIVATPGALNLLTADMVTELLRRHLSGDWGDLSEADQRENEYSVKRALRIFSAYQLPDGDRIWIITAADRSATTILLPSEY